MRTPTRQRGFAYIAAIVLLVVLAAMAAAVVRLNTTQQNNTSAELQGMYAAQAARAGIEWGFYRARANVCRGVPVPPASTTIGPTTLTDFVAGTGFRVTVTIQCRSFNEGELAENDPFEKIIYEIDAVACNGTGPCPATDTATVARPDYVERRRTAVVCATNTDLQPDCFGPPP